MVVGGIRYVKSACMYALLFCLYYGVITQTAHHTHGEEEEEEEEMQSPIGAPRMLAPWCPAPTDLGHGRWWGDPLGLN